MASQLKNIELFSLARSPQPASTRHISNAQGDKKEGQQSFDRGVELGSRTETEL